MCHKISHKKGFTLIEMLVVIAIIAVLVSIVVPVVGNTTDKAKAATDAANLRSVLGLLNIHVVNGQMTVPEIIDTSTNPSSEFDPAAKLYAIYETPGFIAVYYVNGDKYYSIDYLAEISINGPDSEKLTEIGTAKPQVEGKWYIAGEGEVPVG